ncbi:4,5-DOPA dioxygenase extradiol [Chryseolinea sp. T2]|uniref:4,5-DOPA-extradiol-dioxygenase n=1 Tax=Chryseolinea sp. T2 TaxID=3129255 RepID=UPI0030770393
MSTLSDLRLLKDRLPNNGTVMPVLFLGHGSPMNGIEDNEFSQSWQTLGHTLSKPKAVIVISAHWLTAGTRITAMDYPQTIHDFGGFPKALFDVQYPAPGSPILANEMMSLIRSTQVEPDHDWGLDHGAWTIVRHMYPDASIPVLQLSIDYTKPASYHYELAKELGELRKRGVLLLTSGNMVHNLRIINWNLPVSGYDWAIESNEIFKKHLLDGNHKGLIEYERLGSAVRMAIPTPEHYLPLIYAIGLQEKVDAVTIFNDKTLMGSISMTSLLIGQLIT